MDSNQRHQRVQKLEDHHINPIQSDAQNLTTKGFYYLQSEKWQMFKLPSVKEKAVEITLQTYCMLVTRVE